MRELGDKLPSLLDVILAQRGGDVSILNRVIYAAELPGGHSLEEIQSWHRDHAELTFDNYDSELRGLLTHHGACMLHLIEGPSGAVWRYLERIQNAQDSPLASVRVVLSTEDIKTYGFPMWACKSINLPRPDGDLDKKDAIAPSIYRTYMDLLDIGKALLGMGASEQVDALENLRATYHEKLPGNELVGSMAKSNWTTPLANFIDIYSEEVQVLEESERCWPQAPPLQY